MNIILDTCAIIWSWSKPEELTSKAISALQDKNNKIIVSAISAAEIACLALAKRIIINKHWKLWFREIIQENNWEVAPISLSIIEEAYSLPENFHQDPADRFIVATTRIYQGAIITADLKIRNYPHISTIW